MTMDDDEDDKSFIEKAVDNVKHVVTTVTDAAKAALEPEPLKPGETVVIVPPMADGLTPAMPTYVVVPKKPRVKKKAPAKKAVAKKATKKSAKKSKKTAPTKSAKKATKKSAKKVAEKVAKKGKKKAMKAKR